MTRLGVEFKVRRIEVRSRGYVPDVYVRFVEDVFDFRLYDDPVVVAHAMAQLRHIGYVGRSFERAELGLQGRNYIVLEPGREFRQFVVERFGWHDLSQPERDAELRACAADSQR
ncbi:MAG: hypothetical protein QM750_19700 [Rubrivivax sp.]